MTGCGAFSERRRVKSSVTPQTCRQALEAARGYRLPLMGFRARAYKEVTGRFFAGETGTGPLQSTELRRLDHPDRPVATMRHSALTIRAVLSHRTPRFDFGSELPQLAGQASIYEMKFNKEAIENNFRDMGKCAILDALLSPVTVVRTGIRFGDEMFAATGRERDENQWFARLVDGDRYFWDSEASNWEDRAWDAEEYTVPKSLLIDSGIYPEKETVIDALQEEVNAGSMDLVRNLAGNRAADASPFMENVLLVDMFFYDLTGRGDTYKVTFSRNGDEIEFLHYGPWQGPTRGPFTRLVFDPIPHNVPGLSSAAAQYEQARTTDEMWARVQLQAKKSTKKPVVPDGAPDDDVNAMKRDDPDMIRSDAAGQAKVLDLDLVSPSLIDVAVQSNRFANTAAKNPDVLSGQSSDSKTATEFSGLMGMVQVNMKDMQETVETFWASLARSWLWYQLYHPAAQMGNISGNLQFPSGQKYGVVLTPEQKEGEFLDYTIRVSPGSAMFMDESIRSQREDAMIAKALPLFQLEQLSGGFFRGSKFWQDRMMALGADGMAQYFGDMGALQQKMAEMAALGVQPPTPGQIVPEGPQSGNPTDAMRSANAGGAPV